MIDLVTQLKEKEEKKAEYGFLDIFTCSYENPDISGFGVIEKNEEPPTKLEEEANESRKFWQNYDMEKSLDPHLIDPSIFVAARGIASAWRTHLALKTVRQMKFKIDKGVTSRMATLIASTWRKYSAQRRYNVLRDADQANLRRLNEYRKFRRTLLGKGFKVQRWSHSQRKLIPCAVKIDWNIEHIVFEQNIFKRKVYDVQDITLIKHGYASNWLKANVLPTHPEKTLSLFIRDRQKPRAPIVSIDLQFNDIYSNKTLDIQEGRVRCAHFINGVRRLIRELDGDESCFFDDIGAYCRVKKSVFERWERVFMINPKFDPTTSDLDTRLRNHQMDALRSPRGSKNKTFRGPEHFGCFEPFPMKIEDKPQNILPRRLVYQSAQNKSLAKPAYAATWWSETIEIKYGKHAKMAKHTSSYFQEPMRKEKFYLQRCVQNDKGEFIPQFHHRAKHRPVLAPVLELKPFFQAKLQELYGYTGIVGWRNTENGLFELEDDGWRQLCQIAIQEIGSRDAIKYANALLREIGFSDDDNMHQFQEETKVEEAKLQNTYETQSQTASDHTTHEENDSRDDLQLETSSHEGSNLDSPRSSVSYSSIFEPPPTPSHGKKHQQQQNQDEELLRSRRQSLLQHLQKRLLMAMYKPQSRREGFMWQASRITYNQAQKKRYIEQQKKQEELSMQEHAEKLAIIANQETIRASILAKNDDHSNPASTPQSRLQSTSDNSKLSITTPTATTPLGYGHRQLHHQRALNESDQATVYNIVVLVQSYFHKTPLGLIGLYLDISDAPIKYQARRRSQLYKCDHVLCIQKLKPNAAPSLIYAWQNNILCKGDMLVAVDSYIPRTYNELIDCCQVYHKPRDLAFYRPDPKFLEALEAVRFANGTEVSI